MLQTSALRRPYGNQTLIYNWLEDRADVKNERILKPLPSQVYFSYLIHSLRIYIYLHSTIIILLQHTNVAMELFEVTQFDLKSVNLNVNFSVESIDHRNKISFFSSSFLCISWSSTGI